MQHPDPSRHPERRHESSFREAVRRLGDYEPGRSVQQVSQEFGIPIDEIVKLASNENPYGPSPEALAAIPTEFELGGDRRKSFRRRAVGVLVGGELDDLVDRDAELLGDLLDAASRLIVPQPCLLYTSDAADEEDSV